MRVLAKSKSGVTKLRRIRSNEVKRESTGAKAPKPDRPAARPRRRLEPATEDQAMYSCACGYIFQAAVSTSVGCPHCGGSQAW
jgi:hypothetical protein